MFTAFFLYLFFGLILVNANNEFLNPPPDGINIPRDPPFIIRWRCDDCGTTPIILHVFQDNGDSTWSVDTLIDGVATSESNGNYSWTPRTLGDLPIANSIHFNINYGENYFDSGSIFITDSPSSSSVTSSATSSTTTATITNTSPTSVPTSLITPTSSASTIPLSSSTALAPTTSPLAQNNEALKVGLGAGLGVGIPFLLLLGGIAGYALFRRRARAYQNTTYQADDVKLALPSYEAKGPVPQPIVNEWPHELDEYRGPSELHG